MPAHKKSLLLNRMIYAVAAFVVAASGLLWRSSALYLSPFLKKYGADSLWALLVFLLIRFLKPQMNLWISVWIAFTISVCVEVGQLYHAAWIDTIRATRLGSLILGSVFNWPDIPAYAIGIALGALLDAAARRQA